MSNPVSEQRLERRGEYSVSDFLMTSPVVAALSIRERDAQGVFTEEGAPKAAVITLHGRDAGRYRPYAPIRMMNVRITLRANTKTDAGQPDALDRVCAAMEQLFETSNLTAMLNSAPRGIAVLLATRRPGSGHGISGFIRTQVWELELKCLCTEQTNSTLENAWIDGDGTQIVDGDGTALVF